MKRPSVTAAHLKFPGAGVADVEGLDAVNVDPVAVVALRRALRAGVLNRRQARLRLPESRVAGAVGGAVLKKRERRDLLGGRKGTDFIPRLAKSPQFAI